MYENGKISREELAQAIRRINWACIDSEQWGVSILDFKTDAADYTGGRKQFTLDPGTYLYCYMTEIQHRAFYRERDFAIYDAVLSYICPSDYVVMWRIS